MIADEETGIGTYTDAKGFYRLEISADKNITIIFGYAGYETQRRRVNVKAGDTRTIDVRLKESANLLPEFTKKSEKKREEAGSVYLDLSKVNYMPSTIGGVEGLIKLAVGSHNELTSQYSVRGAVLMRTLFT